jgi:hypothetical protein
MTRVCSIYVTVQITKMHYFELIKSDGGWLELVMNDLVPPSPIWI